MQQSELNVHGKNLNPEEREKAAKYFEKFFRKGLEPIAGEVEKSEELLRFVEKINGYLNEELKELGLDEVRLDARRIHILPTEDFKREFPHAEANGVYRDAEDGVYVKQDKSRLQTYKSLLHEVIHQISYGAVYANPETRKIYFTRVGYMNEPATEEHHEHFRGINEAVVDSIVREILNKHGQELIKELSITEEERRQTIVYCRDYIDILDIVIEKISEKNNENRRSVWSRFKKGEFTGEMMHLRDVERTFGKEALRVLAALGSGTKNMPESKLIEQMKNYFQTDNEVVKEKMAKEILIERERLRYDQRSG